MRRKKQKIKFDYSRCKYRDLQRRLTRFNEPAKMVFIYPISEKLAFYTLKNNDVIWVRYGKTPDVPDEQLVCCSDILVLRVRTKKALLRQIRRLKFPKGFTFSIEPPVYYQYSGDCDFLCYIRSDPK